MTRLLVVLGYSERSGTGLHPTCSERLDYAARLATPGDVILLSGWARRAGLRSEAELMHAAWPGAADAVLVDAEARTTVGNARGGAAVARTLPATEVLVVTSRWHAPRAALAFRWHLRGSGARVATRSPRARLRARPLARELVAWPLLLPQLVVSRRGRPRAAVEEGGASV